MPPTSAELHYNNDPSNNSKDDGADRPRRKLRKKPLKAVRRPFIDSLRPLPSTGTSTTSTNTSTSTSTSTSMHPPPQGRVRIKKRPPPSPISLPPESSRPRDSNVSSKPTHCHNGYGEAPAAAVTPAAARPPQREENTAAYDSCVQPTKQSVDSGETLVAFEEERVYFRPVCCYPEHSESAGAGAAAPLASPRLSYGAEAADGVGLRVCMGMLIRELSAAMPRMGNIKHGTTTTTTTQDTSALQVWLMIEAYQKLRHTLGTTSAPTNPAARSASGAAIDALDNWIYALHAVHDSLARPTENMHV